MECQTKCLNAILQLDNAMSHAWRIGLNCATTSTRERGHALRPGRHCKGTHAQSMNNSMGDRTYASCPGADGSTSRLVKR